MADFDIQALLRLLAVSEAGSFSAAARLLGISRQAAHRSVEALEAAAGGALFDRSARQLRPTSLGRQLLAHAVELRRLERLVRASLEHGRAEPSGLVRLTAPPLFAEVVLPGGLASFSKKWPAVRVVARIDSARTDLVRDDYDLMIRIGAEPPADHYAVLLGRASHVLCASARYLAEAGVPDSPEALSQHATLEYGPRASGPWRLSRGAELTLVSVESRLVSDSPTVVVEACRAGAGILRAPQWAVADALRGGELVRVLEAWQPPPTDVWAVYGHRAAGDPTLRELIAELQRTPWLRIED